MAKKTKKTEEITKKFGDERRKALDDALKNIEKDFGKGAVMRLGERAEQKVQVMSSGSLALDIALGAGGYPKGRIIEIYGPESSGKTTVALHAVAQTQKEGGIAAFIDAEHALDPVYAKNIGVDIDNLYRLYTVSMKKQRIIFLLLWKKRTKTLKMLRKNGQNKQKNIGKTDKNIVI